MPKKILKRVEDMAHDAFHGAAGLASSAISNMADMMPGSQKRRGNAAERDTRTLREARSYGNAPNFDMGGMPTDAFKTRAMADEVRNRRMKK